MEDVVKLHAAWCKSLQQAVETDAWGQVLEAVEAYERFVGACVLLWRRSSSLPCASVGVWKDSLAGSRKLCQFASI
jgi:hypothetical protein